MPVVCIIVTTGITGGRQREAHRLDCLPLATGGHNEMGYAKSQATRKKNRSAGKQPLPMLPARPKDEPPIGYLPGEEGIALGLFEDLEHAAGLECDGYYKISPGTDFGSWYLTYHWRHGPLEGRYAMAVVHRGDLSFGLRLLSRKVVGARQGTERTYKDKWYSPIKE